MPAPTQNGPPNFEHMVLPHLDAAYNLARWLTRNEQDAQDVVQEAYLRAFHFFDGFRGSDARGWILKIVRNTAYTWLRQNRAQQHAVEFDEKFLGPDPHSPNPEQVTLQIDNSNLLRRALEYLPSNFREVLVLRELEGMSYKEISAVTGLPAGTVMSSLSRARTRLRQSLTQLVNANVPAMSVPLKPAHA